MYVGECMSGLGLFVWKRRRWRSMEAVRSTSHATGISLGAVAREAACARRQPKAKYASP